MPSPREIAATDAVASALDALYDMAELLKQQGGYSNKTLESLAKGDVGAETTLGLLCARGAKAHALLDFGDLHTFGSHGFGEGPYGGGWAWQTYVDMKYPTRSSWYGKHVHGNLVAVPFKVAVDWLSKRPEISPSSG